MTGDGIYSLPVPSTAVTGYGTNAWAHFWALQVNAKVAVEDTIVTFTKHFIYTTTREISAI